MYNQAAKSAHFQALHVPGQPLVLFNIWDPGSARAVMASGAKAIATGSWSVAKAFGYDDGEKLPLTLVIANLQRIAHACDLPVSVDLESGYSTDAAGVSNTIAKAINAGAVGCNLEDSDPVSGAMRGIAEQASRISYARAGAASETFFINARSDVFFQTPPESHTYVMLEQAIARAESYATAGANGIFLPGLTDLQIIAAAVKRSPLPVNIMLGSSSVITRQQLADVGVARISHGPGPYRLVLKHLQDAAKLALQ